MAIETHPITLDTIDGLRLDGDLIASPGPHGAVVVCHPHPLYGGDRFNPVVDAVARAAAAHGWAAVRFDFRGVNESEGTHGGGIDERLDVAAAIDMVSMLTDGPIWLIGYSFGAMVVLSVTHPRIDGWVAIAPPLAAMPGDVLAATDHRPKHVLVAGHDQFSPPEATLPLLATWENTTHAELGTADHFLAGHLGAVGEFVVAALGD